MKEEQRMLDHNPFANCTVGERYEAQVPDTLDLADRMGLAINALTNVWYPDEKWALGFNVEFNRRPVTLSINHVTDAYLNIPPKFLEGLAVCRLGSGNEDNLDVDREVLRAQLGFLGDDGLTYCPTDTLPLFTEPPRPYAEGWAEGRSLLALSMLAQLDDDPRWAAFARRKLDRLLALTREKAGFRFLWRGELRPGQVVPPDADEPGRKMGDTVDWEAPLWNVAHVLATLGHGSGLFYRVAGYEPALELSRGLARWALARIFTNEDGRYDVPPFHLGTVALIAVCEYGYATNNREVLERVDACYRWAREMGDPLTGFYLDFMLREDRYLYKPTEKAFETCGLADMVVLALYLTRAGLGDYWDDVDRWVRNMYAEAQILDTDFLERIPESYFPPESEVIRQAYEDTRDVPRRSVGSFWGWMRPNDGLYVEATPQGWRLRPGGSIQHCCTGNGSRTLYYVWDSIVTREAGETRVNLLLNRASPWLDVDSYLPVEGKVVLHVKDAPTVAVRMPEWCDPATVRVTVADEARRTLVDGRFIRVGWLKPGDEVTLAFPVPERVEHRVIGEAPYKLVVRGSNVVSIDPKGVAYPLYERQPTGKPVSKTRFVPRTRQVIW